jgi:hypothetical protein
MKTLDLNKIIEEHAVFIRTGGKAGVRANLCRANLQGANLCRANLCRANLQGANLCRANLCIADLRKADLREANLQGTYLQGANLREALLPDFQIVPETGGFYAWKKLADGCIATLYIPARSKRTSCLVSRKCRAEYVKVMGIWNKEGKPISQKKNWNTEFPIMYKVGQTVKADRYNGDIKVECTGGIHFFLTKQEAMKW